jgi:hypothetical protein
LLPMLSNCCAMTSLSLLSDTAASLPAFAASARVGRDAVYGLSVSSMWQELGRC